MFYPYYRIARIIITDLVPPVVSATPIKQHPPRNRTKDDRGEASNAAREGPVHSQECLSTTTPYAMKALAPL